MNFYKMYLTVTLKVINTMSSCLEKLGRIVMRKKTFLEELAIYI